MLGDIKSFINGIFKKALYLFTVVRGVMISGSTAFNGGHSARSRNRDNISG